MSYRKSTLDPALKNMGKRWSKDDDTQIVKLLAKGKDLGHIAQALFRTENSIRYRIYGKAYGEFRIGTPVEEILKKYRLGADEFQEQRTRIEEQERADAEKAQEILSGKNQKERSIKLGRYENVEHFKSHLSTESDHEDVDLEDPDDDQKSNLIDDSEEEVEEDGPSSSPINDFIDKIQNRMKEVEERCERIEEVLNTLTLSINSLHTAIYQLQKKK